MLISSSGWVFSGLQWGDLGTQASIIWSTLQGGSSAFSPKQGEWQSVDIVLLVYGQVCISCHVHHVKISRSQIPWPNLTAKEVGRHSLSVYLGWGMGPESKEPGSALLLGTRYWGLAARWDGWHIIAHSPRLPRFRYVQFIWGTGILTQREGQILAMNLLLLVSVFSNRLGFACHFLFAATATRTCLFPILEAEIWVSLPSTSTDTKKTHKTSSWKEDFISRLWLLFEIKCPIFRRDSLTRPSRKKPSQSAESLLEAKWQMSWHVYSSGTLEGEAAVNSIFGYGCIEVSMVIRYVHEHSASLSRDIVRLHFPNTDVALMLAEPDLVNKMWVEVTYHFQGAIWSAWLVLFLLHLPLLPLVMIWW